jgi:hypothetical protein
MSDINPVQMNRAFLSYMDNEEGGREKMAAAGAKFVRDHLREEAAVRRILPPEQLDPTAQRVVPALNSDTLVVRKDLEPQSRAVALTFGTQPEATIVSAPRIDIPIFTISSEMFQIREQHLLAYEMPITRLIEENTGKDIQEIEDLEWLTFSDASVQTTGRIIKGSQATADIAVNGLNTGFRGEIERPDIVDLANGLLDGGNRKRLDRVWMNDVDFNNVLKWTVEDAGDKNQSETMIDGYKYDVLLGKKIVRTVKTDLLATGNFYGYTSPDFLGFFFILNNVKFYIDKVANLIRWQAWEDIAISIANISSVAKIELYNGTGAPPVAGSDALPAEDDLFTQTNPAFTPGGAVFPQVTLS